jgi:hypothetical protein
MKPHQYILAVLLVAGGIAGAADGVWHDERGRPVPDEESRKSVSGFGGWLLITPDPDWQQKWETPSSTTPVFSTAKSVKVGGRVAILIFFVSPKPDARGAINIGCDILVRRGNGTLSIDSKDVDCASGPIGPNPYNVRLADQWLNMIAESGDPLGKWEVEVNVRDRNRNVSVPLKASFTLVL